MRSRRVTARTSAGSVGWRKGTGTQGTVTPDELEVLANRVAELVAERLAEKSRPAKRKGRRRTLREPSPEALEQAARDLARKGIRVD